MRKLICIKLIVLLFISPLGIFAQSVEKKISVKNNSTETILNYTVETPVRELNLSLSTYIAQTGKKSVPVELSQNIKGEHIAIFTLDKIAPKQELTINLIKGNHDLFPKLTYAELSHKIGGQFVGRLYMGGFSWVKVNTITLPGNFKDHSYYIKYEGPGWENDKVAFRFYLDNRNAIDVFGKVTSNLVLPSVGVDGFDSYHELSFWGMDNLKVGKGLGLGTIAYWDGKNAIRVENRDSTTCTIVADGKVRSQVKTIYHGWQVENKKVNLTSLISLDAGSRASHMELFVDNNIDNIATGIIKNKDTKLITGDKNNEWTYIATFGKQSLNKDMQGLVIFVRTNRLKEITEDSINHVVVLEVKNNYLDYYFMPTWELDKEPVATEEDLMKCINEVLNRLNDNVKISIK